MSPSPPYVTFLDHWYVLMPWLAVLVNVAAVTLNLRSMLAWRRRVRELQPTGRCPVCERLKRDHTRAQIEACLQRAQAEAAQDGRIVIPVACPTCGVNAFLAAAANCGGCGKPLVMGTMADVS